MFFTFTNWHAGAALSTVPPTQTDITGLIRLHPQVLIHAIEHFFSSRAPLSGEPDYRLPAALQPSGYGATALEAGINSPTAPKQWEHLIYAYMIENTRIFEIFDRVVREYEAGERFETPDPDTALWLRTTEALFYRDQVSGFAGSLTSWIRPDLRATRRNSYYRLLGMDLNHGIDGNRAYQFDKPTAANRDFVATFEDFLREVWRGMVNANNSSGPNDTDDQAIADHARRLKEMLNVRRNNGNLVREEFWAVVTLSWFHLAVAQDTPVVIALKAEAESPGDRLRKIGERVGIPSHNRADDYFNMALELSVVLSYIERSPDAIDPGKAAAYYKGPSLVIDQMRRIITHWSQASARDIKSLRVVPGTAMVRTQPAGTTNGRALVTNRN